MILLGMTALLAFVMVSTFRYRSFKDLDLKRRLPFSYLVIGVGVIGVVAWWPEVMLFCVFMAYAALGAIFGILGWGRPPKQNKIIEPADLEVDGDDLHEEVEDEEENQS